MGITSFYLFFILLKKIYFIRLKISVLVISSFHEEHTSSEMGIEPNLLRKNSQLSEGLCSFITMSRNNKLEFTYIITIKIAQSQPKMGFGQVLLW